MFLKWYSKSIIWEISMGESILSWVLTVTIAVKGRTEPFPGYKEILSRLL